MKSSISVIIPCYNGWRYMERCLKCMENQTIPPHEVIVVDDCSQDDSYIRLTEYASSAAFNLVVLKNECNCGPGVSRKRAIDVACGDYVAFCDCDDWYELDFIESITEAISTEHADIVVFDNYNTYDDRKIVANTVKPLQNNKKSMIANIGMSLCRLVVKRQIAQQVVFPALYYGEDGAVVPQLMAKANTFTLIDRPLYNYYYRIGSVSQKPSSKACSQMIAAFSVVSREMPQEYRIECEYIGIKCVCYSAVLCGLKNSMKATAIKAIITDFEAEYPAWQDNPYRKNLGKLKNLYLFFIKRRWLVLVKMMAFLHTYYIKLRKK